MSVVDATIRVGGIVQVALSSLDLTLDIQPSAPPVFGSGAIKYAPDAFTGPLLVSMNLTMLRKDLTLFSDFIAETVYSLSILAVDNMSEPKDLSISWCRISRSAASIPRRCRNRAAVGRKRSRSRPP
jgi:hypothetical protein